MCIDWMEGRPMTRSDQNLRHEAIRAECLRLGLGHLTLRRCIVQYDGLRAAGVDSDLAQSGAFRLAQQFKARDENLRLRAGSIRGE